MAHRCFIFLEERWRKGSEWGEGAKGAVMTLVPNFISKEELGEVVKISSHPGWLAKMKADYKPFVPSPDDLSCNAPVDDV
jgi:hypothetical protein